MFALANLRAALVAGTAVALTVSVAFVPFEAGLCVVILSSALALATNVVARARIDGHLAGLHGSSFEDPDERAAVIDLRRLRLSLMFLAVVGVPLIGFAVLIAIGGLERSSALVIATALALAIVLRARAVSSTVGPVSDAVWAYAATVDPSVIGRRSLGLGRWPYLRALISGSL